MYKWMLVFLLVGLGFGALAEKLPNCTSAQTDTIIHKIKTDKVFNKLIHDKKMLIKQYPNVKNCSAAQYDECKMGTRYWEICDSANCKFTEEQEIKLDMAVIERIGREFSDRDLRAAWDYFTECFPQGRIYCNSSTIESTKKKRPV